MTKAPKESKVVGVKRSRPKSTARAHPAGESRASASDKAAVQPAISRSTVSPHVEVLDVGLHNPEVRAKAEIQAFNDFFTILADRANAHGLEPTKIVRVADGYMICFLKADGTYGNCRPYTNPV